MDEYMAAIVCKALLAIAADLSLTTDVDPDLLIERALLDVSLSIQDRGIKNVINDIHETNSRLYDKVFTIS